MLEDLKIIMTFDDDDNDDQSTQGQSLFDRPAPPPIPKQTFAWNDDQLRAIDAVLSWRTNKSTPRFLKLTGPAGSGKTAVTRELRRRLLGTATAWSGMTGKAALRLREAVGAKTSTAHSALYHGPREIDNVEEAKIDLLFNDVKRGDVEDTLLVIDEASMISPRFRADVERSPTARSSSSAIVISCHPCSPRPRRLRSAARTTACSQVFQDHTSPR